VLVAPLKCLAGGECGICGAQMATFALAETDYRA
jgi:hypothetical protein